jgi:hypothetical protein
MGEMRLTQPRLAGWESSGFHLYLLNDAGTMCGTVQASRFRGSKLVPAKWRCIVPPACGPAVDPQIKSI